MRILVVLVLSISIGLLGFMVYLDLNEEKIAQKSPLIAFPVNPVFLLEIEEITSTWNHFTETNMIWSAFTSNEKRECFEASFACKKAFFAASETPFCVNLGVPKYPN